MSPAVGYAVMVVAFVFVFAIAALVLDWFLPEAEQGHRPRALSIAPMFALATPGDVFEWLWVIWAIVMGLLAVWAIWSYVGPTIVRWFPRMARACSRVLPLATDPATDMERPRWTDDASPRRRVIEGPTRLDLIKRLRPGQQPQAPRSGGRR